MKYNNNFQTKLICSKLKVHQTNRFHERSRRVSEENTFTTNLEKIFTVVLIQLDFLEQEYVRESKNQGLNPILYSEFPTHTRYLIYKLTFALSTILTQLNHVRYDENIKLHWEKYEALKSTTQCFRCQTHIRKLQKKTNWRKMRMSAEHKKLHKNASDTLRKTAKTITRRII
ncbi:unnamed protein product [Heterotrigona itama]|uniref:Uncharacterized protein n=1 Tax=Heterotrigona itama TaxID=395501 RepID=A0A6V7HLF5_9HYME|nr:unnamed protein product [Heterotrigona itama]